MYSRGLEAGVSRSMFSMCRRSDSRSGSSRGRYLIILVVPGVNGDRRRYRSHRGVCGRMLPFDPCRLSVFTERSSTSHVIGQSLYILLFLS
jgi:hypothetical protein